MMVSFAFNYNVTVPFIDSDATLCLITSIFIKGGARGGRRSVYQCQCSVMGISIFTDLKKQNKTNNVELSSAESLCPNDFHVLIKKSLVLFK